VELHLCWVFKVIYLSYLDQAVITNANESDRSQLGVLVNDQSWMYGFDYMTDHGYLLVSRLRKNAIVRVVYTFSLPKSLAVFSE